MLVNVAAVSLKTWREVFAVNVEAVLTASQQAAVRQAPRAMLPADLQNADGSMRQERR